MKELINVIRVSDVTCTSVYKSYKITLFMMLTVQFFS